LWFKTQPFILGTGTAIWWMTEPHSNNTSHPKPNLHCLAFLISFVNNFCFRLL